MNLKQLLTKHLGERDRFERIKNPLSTHRDMCAMMILSKFMTNPKHTVINSVVDGSEDACYDLIVFEPSIHDIETMATEEQVIDLIRCGCRYNGEYDALVMDI